MVAPIKTNHPLVYRFDNILSHEDFSYIENHLKSKIPYIPNINSNLEPWHENQNLLYNNINDYKTKKLINSCRFLINQLTFFSYKQLCFPTHTDLVLWQEGRRMEFHVDDGREDLLCRHYSSVLYINDNYEGGETIIKGSPNYISKPKKGSIIIFESNIPHRVNKVLKGHRATLALWFTKDKNHIEI